MNKKVFVLNDETQTNSYGFRVKTEGISLARFENNPVCLNNHKNDTKNVLGKWVDVQKEGARLTASPEFDTEDTEGKEVVRKVEKGILKACSIGITFKPENVKMIDGVPVVEQCELMEASIVAVPSNAQSVTLYNDKGEALSHDEAKTFCLSFQSNTNTNNKMNKEILSLLKLADNANEDAVKEAIKDTVANLSAVTAERDQLKTEVTNLREAQTQRQTAEFSAELERAIKDGRIDADGAEPVKELQKANHAQAMKLLAGLKPHASVNDQINKGDSASELAKLSWDELDKQGKLAYLKANDFPLYAEKFKAKFGVEPNAQ
ncbi:HK97 family phage prohead protease [Capnocytophaga canimorsus]|uniref:HK97 family phage prohead protease n=1 Tax=Capnocytophaga canimorsus TaxID=28188 RepID=UPI00385E0A12